MIQEYLTLRGLLAFDPAAHVQGGIPEAQAILAIYGDASQERSELWYPASEILVVEDVAGFDRYYEPERLIIVVGSPGLALALQLVEHGKITGDTVVTWDLGASVWDTWRSLSSLSFLRRSVVKSVSVLDGRALLTTAAMTAPIDHATFGLGFLLGQIVSDGQGNAGFDHAEVKTDLDNITHKHLSLLEALGSISFATNPSEQGVIGSNSESKILENELVRIKRQHDSLERKYKSLANSKFGKFTLMMWDMKKNRALRSSLRRKKN